MAKVAKRAHCAILAANAAWFTAGFIMFVGAARSIAGGLTRQPQSSQSAAAAAGLLRFLGGLNLGYAVLAGMALGKGSSLRNRPVALVFALAHGSQAAVNLEVALRRRRGHRGPWSTGRFPMSLIFAGDSALAAANLLTACMTDTRSASHDA